LFGVNSWIAQNDQAVNYRLLVRRQKMHRSETGDLYVAVSLT